jgi:hypothetical protein
VNLGGLAKDHDAGRQFYSVMVGTGIRRVLERRNRSFLRRSAKIQDAGQQPGDLFSNAGEELWTLTDRVGDVEELAGRYLSAQRGEFVDLLSTALGNDRRGFLQGEGAAKLARRHLQDGVAVLPSHGQDQVGAAGDLGVDLPRREVPGIAAVVLNNMRRIRVHFASDDRSDAGARNGHAGDAQLARQRGSQPLSDRRATDISGADEQDVQNYAADPEAVRALRAVA